MDDNGRPPIPLPMQRAIRQRCRFGCVLCGKPIYQYHHLLGFDLGVGHVADEITLLCPDHHADFTAGRIPQSVITRANANPVNRGRRHCKPWKFHPHYGAYSVTLGNVRLMGIPYQAEYWAVLVNSIPLITIGQQDDVVLLSVIIRDIDGNVQVQIDENELTYRTDSWDVEFVGSQLTIRRDRGKIAFQAAFGGQDAIHIRRATLISDGIAILLHEKRGVEVLGTYGRIANIDFRGGDFGLAIGPAPPGLVGFFAMQAIPVSREELARIID